jgi:hypothetical protein
MAGKVLKMGAIAKIQQSEATKLRARVAKLKSQKRGLSQRYTNLYNRTADLIEYLDQYILPKQRTTRKKQLHDAVEHVRKLL